MTEAGFLAHVRRQFHELWANDKSDKKPGKSSCRAEDSV